MSQEEILNFLKANEGKKYSADEINRYLALEGNVKAKKIVWTNIKKIRQRIEKVGIEFANKMWKGRAELEDYYFEMTGYEKGRGSKNHYRYWYLEPKKKKLWGIFK